MTQLPEKFPLEDPAFLNIRSSLDDPIERTITIEGLANIYATKEGHIVAIEAIEGPITPDILAQVIFELTWDR